MSESNDTTITVTYVVTPCILVGPDGEGTGFPPIKMSHRVVFAPPEVSHLDEANLLVDTQKRLLLLSQVSEVVALSNHQYSRAVNRRARELGIELDQRDDRPDNRDEKL